ncbi:10619_t:CDS:2 [Funneliformis mosseae]|uniref:10619_t:CDS:1 n=1 Tax=Funneliformis mosseae TaxID=27381 RepID=A0A9N9CIA9_FUNMO|nr:10619_t:CDS:2 [Funneliformis mosseae]
MPKLYLPIEDYSTFNNQEYGMEHIFTNFLLVENNQKSVLTYGADSNYINYRTEEVLSVENPIGSNWTNWTYKTGSLDVTGLITLDGI